MTRSGALACSLLITSCMSAAPRPADRPADTAAPAAAPAPRAAFAWPRAAKAAVSLTYDDGIRSHLDEAGPALARHGLLATFFISNNNGTLEAERERWKALRAAGHEFASHTVHHPCSKSNSWVPQGFGLEDYTLERMGAELDESIALLQSLGQERGPYTFAYPCGSTWVHDQGTSYAPLVAQRFAAARTSGAGVADPGGVDLQSVPTFGADGHSGATLIGLVDQAVAKRGWIVFTFHGVAGDYLVTSKEAHDALLAHLAAHQAELWTERFGEVSRWIAERR
jgi:peptidoglycan-N-acetylglucosamine deacetylase